MPSPGESRLSIANVIAEAFWHPWTRRRAFFKALFLPSIAILALQLGLRSDGMPPGAAAWMVWILWVLLWILFAVACHRLVLLGLHADDVPVVPGWGWRETRFLGCILFITAVTWGAVFAAVIPFGIVVGSVSETAFKAGQPYLSGLVGIFFFARMGPVLPAAAIGERIDFREMWRRTRGNTWRLMVIVGVLPWLFGVVSDWLSGTEAGAMREIAAFVVATMFLAVEIAALSVSYRRLVAAQ